jgi:phosphatidylserine/phosphatidylglycerophosphate/cardiolipin synthase-like enzyme
MTGSHNLDHKASFNNDENLVIVKGVDGTPGWGERRCHPLDRAGRVAVPLLQRRRNHQERAAKVPAVVTAVKLKPPERAIMMFRQCPVYPPPGSRR